ncbi:MAG TPA: leucyl aminopeptidase family protein [Micromonosporaceae bacterium]
MLNVRLDSPREMSAVLALPVLGDSAGIPATTLRVPSDVLDEARALLAAADDPGGPGAVQPLPRPLREPGRLLLVGVGTGDEAGWRAAGAALTRASAGETSITVALPEEAAPDAVRGLAEGFWLASYRFRIGADAGAPRLAEVVLAVADQDRYVGALGAARATADATFLSRDLTNTPSSTKNPAWFADEITRAASGRDGLSVRVRGPEELAADGFGGILAVGGGSASGPRLVETSWRPAGARTHVVLVGKGITFDTGGISIKPRDAMKLMRKDMSGAAVVTAAVLGAAAMKLPVRVTALAPLAENMVSGSAYRPGDVIRHFGGLTSESTNTDAEGRLVLADTLAYAVARLAPDLLVDLATLTGANAVALGKRTAALYSDNDGLADALSAAATAAGEQVWRMPLPADYVEYIGSDIADFHSSPDRGAGSVVAALYLREFTGELRDRWAHIDFSAPSWVDTADGELATGATGWGARTLLRWLATLT